MTKTILLFAAMAATLVVAGCGSSSGEGGQIHPLSGTGKSTAPVGRGPGGKTVTPPASTP